MFVQPILYHKPTPHSDDVLIFISILDFEDTALQKLSRGKFRPWKMKLHRELFCALFNPDISSASFDNWWIGRKLEVACSALLEAHDLKPHEWVIKPKRRDTSTQYNRAAIVSECGYHLAGRMSFIKESLMTISFTIEEHAYIVSCEFAFLYARTE